jgi:Tfp pilus assembly protein PilV
MAEVLVALLVFSIAVVGALRAQLGALTATRDTVAQLRASRLLEDLVQRGDSERLALLAPATLMISGRAVAPANPIALDDWAAQWQAGPLEARLCIVPQGELLEVAISWQSSRTPAAPACAGGAPRVVAHMVAP